MPAFEDKLERLEEVSEQIREGEISLEESIKLFEEGIKLAKMLEKELSKIERKVEILLNQPSPDAPPQMDLFPENEEE
ncbi:MAG: exodeoxyribonuclease VII small subunit [Spirochaetales bacterium]|nr:exodeoxyribonuclease VII small subunit [Spirochaetales bacterium]